MSTERGPAHRTIPTTVDYVPDFPGPHQAPPDRGLIWTVSFETIESNGDTDTIRHSQQWRIAGDYEVDCGSRDHEYTLELEFGLTQSQSEKLAASLSAGLRGLQASIGADVEATSATSQRRRSTYSAHDLSTGRCEQLKIVFWQRWEIVEVQRTTRRALRRPKRHDPVVESWPADSVVERRVKWQEPRCCRDDPELTSERAAFQVLFGKGKAILRGMKEATGVRLSHVDRTVRLGGAIAYTELPIEMAWVVEKDMPEATFGLLLPAHMTDEDVDTALDLLTSEREVRDIWVEQSRDDLEPLQSFPVAYDAAAALIGDRNAVVSHGSLIESLLLPVLVEAARPDYFAFLNSLSAEVDGAPEAEDVREAPRPVGPAGTQLSQVLAEIPLFSGLSQEDLASLAFRSRLLRVPAGRTFMREGSSRGGLVVLLEGGVEVRRGTERIANLGPGSFFGDLALLDRRPRNVNVTTTTPATLFVLGEREFAALIEENPGFAHKLLSGMARRLRTFDAEAAR